MSEVIPTATVCSARQHHRTSDIINTQEEHYLRAGHGAIRVEMWDRRMASTPLTTTTCILYSYNILLPTTTESDIILFTIPTTIPTNYACPSLNYPVRDRQLKLHYYYFLRDWMDWFRVSSFDQASALESYL